MMLPWMTSTLENVPVEDVNVEDVDVEELLINDVGHLKMTLIQMRWKSKTRWLTKLSLSGKKMR